jgi:hypothetical protein
MAGHVGVGDQDTHTALHPHHRLQHVDRIGDHRAGQNVVDGDVLAVEHRAGMRARIRTLVDCDFRQSCWVVTEKGGVSLRDLRVRSVLAHVAVRNFELGLR